MAYLSQFMELRCEKCDKNLESIENSICHSCEAFRRIQQPPTSSCRCLLCTDKLHTCDVFPCRECMNLPSPWWFLTYVKGIDPSDCSWKICPKHMPEWRLRILQSEQSDAEKQMRINNC